jgi:hypothetical protein
LFADNQKLYDINVSVWKSGENAKAASADVIARGYTGVALNAGAVRFGFPV